MSDDLILKREELYEAVWAEPALKLAAKYGISSVALAKICRKLCVPLPGRGYWAKAEAGRRVRPHPPLRPLPPGRRPVHIVYAYRRRVAETISPEAHQAMTREREPDARIIVTDVFADPHRFLRRVRGKLFRAALKSEKLRLERRCVDITVSRAQLDRALRVMDALLKALEARGYEVYLSDPTETAGSREPQRLPSVTGVYINNVAVEFGVEEVIDTFRRGEPKPKGEDVGRWLRWRSRNPPPFHLHMPSGRLALVIRNGGYNAPRRSWRDGKRRRVEDMMNEFVANIIVTAERLRTEQEERAWQRRAAEEARLRYEEEERHRKLEAERLRDLDSRLQKLELAAKIRALVAAVRTRAQDSSCVTAEVSAWIEWANGMAADADRGATAMR